MNIWIDAIFEVLTITNILVIVLGTLYGMTVGALPGLTPSMAVALAIPMTFALPPATGLILLGAIYCSSMYGGSISAILLNTPGTAAAAATTLDGYALTRKGQAKKALAIAAIASAIGGIISVIILSFVAPFLAEQALRFGPTEYFSLAIFGLAIVSNLTADNLFKGLMIAMFGVLIATVGMDSISGEARYTFSQQNLLGGIGIIPIVIGLFSLSQVFMLIKNKSSSEEARNKYNKKQKYPSGKEIGGQLPNILRSSLIGTGIGIIPGAGGDTAAFISYNEAKRWSKNPNEFGKGNIAGIAAPESANNAVTGGTLIPLLTLGIPGNTVTAIFLGGLLIHGLKPGPDLFINNGDIIYSLFFSLALSNIAFLIFGLIGANYFSKIINVSNEVLIPIILLLSIVGSFAVHNNFFEVWLMFVFGIIGFLLRLINVPLAPLILGVILGPIAETGYRQSMLMSDGSFSIFLTSPISLIFIILAIVTFFSPIIKKAISNTN